MALLIYDRRSNCRYFCNLHPVCFVGQSTLNRTTLTASALLATIVVVNFAYWWPFHEDVRGAPGVSGNALPDGRDPAASDSPENEAGISHELGDSSELREEDTVSDAGIKEEPKGPDPEAWEWKKVEPLLDGMMHVQDAGPFQETLVKWPKDLTTAKAVEVFGVVLSESALAELGFAVADDNALLENEAAYYVAMLEQTYRDTYNYQKYRKYNTAAGETVPEVPAGTSVHQFPGWTVIYRIDFSDNPGLVTSMEKIKEMRQVRDSKAAVVLNRYR